MRMAGTMRRRAYHAVATWEAPSHLRTHDCGREAERKGQSDQRAPHLLGAGEEPTVMVTSVIRVVVTATAGTEPQGKTEHVHRRSPWLLAPLDEMR